MGIMAVGNVFGELSLCDYVGQPFSLLPEFVDDVPAFLVGRDSKLPTVSNNTSPYSALHFGISDKNNRLGFQSIRPDFAESLSRVQNCRKAGVQTGMNGRPWTANRMTFNPLNTKYRNGMAHFVSLLGPWNATSTSWVSLNFWCTGIRRTTPQ